jgi:hypothetical protein
LTAATSFITATSPKLQTAVEMKQGLLNATRHSLQVLDYAPFSNRKVHDRSSSQPALHENSTKPKCTSKLTTKQTLSNRPWVYLVRLQTRVTPSLLLLTQLSLPLCQSIGKHPRNSHNLSMATLFH